MVNLNHDPPNKNSLEHHGIKGQRWGVRRYQNSDGSIKGAGQRTVVKTMDKPIGKSSERVKVAGAIVGGAAVGAAAVGAAWYLKNKSNVKLSQIKRAAITAKSAATRAANKNKGLYSQVKNLKAQGIGAKIIKGEVFVNGSATMSLPLSALLGGG